VSDIEKLSEAADRLSWHTTHLIRCGYFLLPSLLPYYVFLVAIIIGRVASRIHGYPRIAISL